MSNGLNNGTSRFIYLLLVVCCCLMSVSCVSAEVQQLTEKHGDEMRAAFSRYFELTHSGAQYGDAETLREVATERYLKKVIFSADSEIRDLLVRYEIKEFWVLEYSTERAKIQVHWAAWHHNVNVATGEEWAANLLEGEEVAVFIKENGTWKMDNIEGGWRIYPPEP